MTRRQRRKVIIVAVLAALLAGIFGYYLYYRSTKQLRLEVSTITDEALPAPQFLYAFSGTRAGRLQRPLGVLADSGRVFVVDSQMHVIRNFDELGNDERSFGASQTVTPLYIARNPKDGLLYVTDRRSRSIHKFTFEGAYRGEFKPNLPKDQLPKFKTTGGTWAPVAIAFGPDGTLYVTEILNGHRLLIFSPSGKFLKSVGTGGTVSDAGSGPLQFQFPNDIAVHKGLVYVADSNNRRIQVFDSKGNFKKLVVTQGLPRGIAFLYPMPGDRKDTPDRYAVVDTLAHDVTIWSAKDQKLVKFGEQGIGDGQFNFPGHVSVTSKNKIFVSDGANGRVQVWGWPSQASAVPAPKITKRSWIWLLPLLLLLWPLFTRKRRMYATTDFIEALVVMGRDDLLSHKRIAWLVSEADAAELAASSVAGVAAAARLVTATEHSESDARALRERYGLDAQTAIVMALAKRAVVFGTENAEWRKVAKVLEIDVVEAQEFASRYGITKGGETTK